MDVNDLRITVMLLSLVLFLALALHTYSRSRRLDHQQAAALPLLEEAGAATGAQETAHE